MKAASKQDYLLKLIVIGDASAGKSSIILQYVDGYIHSSHLSTIGVDFKIKNLKYEDKRLKLQIWDTAGQEKFKHLTNNYYRNAHACIVVFDVTCRKSFENVEYWVHQFRQGSSASQQDPASGHVFVLAANKIDLAEERKVTREEGESLAEELGMPYEECSAKEGKNINQIFSLAIDQIFHKYRGTQLRTHWEDPFSIAEHSSDGRPDPVASLFEKPLSQNVSVRITHQSMAEAKVRQKQRKCCI